MTMHNDEVTGQSTAETVVDKAQDTASQAGKKVAETASVAKEQAKRTVAQVGEQAKQNVGSRMGEVAEELGTVADAVRQTSEELSAQDQTGIARYGTRIADQIESVSSYLNERGVEDVLTDVEDLARRQPALFLGGALMLGILVGRFLRSSGHEMSYEQGGYDNSGYGNYQGSQYSSPSYQSSGRSSGSGASNQGRSTTQGWQNSQGGRPSTEMGAQTGANESRYRQGPSVYNTSNQEEFGDNPTAYPTGLAESDE